LSNGVLDETLHHICDQLGIPDHSVDVLVFNMLAESKTSLAYKQKVDNSPLLRTLSSLLQRWDIGPYCRTNNLWITHPPDKHPCMPGIPDDEVNVLFYLLFGGYGIKLCQII
jgi:hypothetical protein